ncbi:hypothetical protein RSAG8_14004, partial [Rhizoctonia solani AG-8 WAC10335]
MACKCGSSYSESKSESELRRDKELLLSFDEPPGYDDSKQRSNPELELEHEQVGKLY